MVGSGPVHCAAGTSSPIVSAADNDADLNTCIYAFLDAFAESVDNIKIKTHCLVAGESLAAEFEKYSFVNRFHNSNSL